MRFIVLFFFLCAACSSPSSDPGSGSETNTPSAPPADPGKDVPEIPAGDLARENIGTKTRVANLFDRWAVKSSVSAGRGSQYADVTVVCHGKIDLNFALTAAEWQDRDRKNAYYRDVNDLIENVGARLLADRGNVFAGSERESFLRALKALAWQESGWQHYLRYKDWFFVFLSGGSYNVLDDWGITQVARSGFSPSELLNREFFERGDHCDITKSLYYGFTEYYDAYLVARSLSCNQTGDPMDKLLGAYNQYSSGYSSCRNGLSSDLDYRTYQINAMNGLKSRYQGQPWTDFIGD